MDRSILVRYKRIKGNYNLLIAKAQKKYNWDTKSFMDTISALIIRRDRELENYLELHAKS